MVNRTDVFGDIIEPDSTEESQGYNLNIEPYGKPLLLIFSSEQKNVDAIVKEVCKLPGVFKCESARLNIFAPRCRHIIVVVDMLTADIIGRWKNDVSQGLLAIDLEGTLKLPNNIFKLDFTNKSIEFVIAYLTRFLK